MTVCLHLFESGALASAYKNLINPIQKKRKAFSIGQEVLNHSYLEFELDKQKTERLIEIINQPSQTYLDFHHQLLKLLGGSFFINEQTFGWARISVNGAVKTLYNIHTLYDFENSFMKISSYGGFVLKASHHHTFNTVNDEILAIIDLLEAKNIGDDYRIDNLTDDEKIIFMTSKVIFELVHNDSEKLGKKIYRFKRFDEQVGEYISLKILQADRARVIPCVNLCRYVARFLESMTDGYHKHNLLEFNKDIANPDLAVSEILKKYDYDILISKPFVAPVVHGVFD